MKATVVDLRYKMSSVLKALERNEEVTLLHRGKVKGTIIPKGAEHTMKAADHPFVGSAADDTRSVKEIMEELRKPRHGDI